jgi:TonB family protein
MPQHLPELALQDDLTGVYNRRYLSELLAERWPELVARHGEVAILIVDLDAFKAINDTHGHLTGDEVLRTTARVLREHLRDEDVIVRYGGDEFVAVVPGVGATEVNGLAERAREALSVERLVSSRSGKVVVAPVGFSIGVASGPADGATGEAVLEAADHRLYQDKRRRGRPAAWLFLPKKAMYVALGIAIVFGLLLGSYVGARVETSVSARRAVPVPAVSAPPATAPVVALADPRVDALVAEIARLEQRLAEVPAVTPLPADPAAAERERRIAELESEIARLRAAIKPSPTAAPRPAPTLGPVTILVPHATPAESHGVPHASPTPERARDGKAAAAPTPAPTPAASPVPTPAPVVVTPATVLAEVRPRYPRVAQALRLEADVEVRVVVDEHGTVTSAEVQGGAAGYGFDHEAKAAALGTRFQPATRDGQAVASEAVLAYRFRLQG